MFWKKKQLVLSVIAVLSVVLPVTLKASRLYASLNAEEVLIDEWLQEGPPTTVLWKARNMLASIKGLGPFLTAKPADPISECGIDPDIKAAELSWPDYLVWVHGAPDRVACLRHRMKEQRDFYTDITNSFLMTVIVLILVQPIIVIRWVWKNHFDFIAFIDFLTSHTSPPQESLNVINEHEKQKVLQEDGKQAKQQDNNAHQEENACMTEEIKDENVTLKMNKSDANPNVTHELKDKDPLIDDNPLIDDRVIQEIIDNSCIVDNNPLIYDNVTEEINEDFCIGDGNPTIDDCITEEEEVNDDLCILEDDPVIDNITEEKNYDDAVLDNNPTSENSVDMKIHLPDGIKVYSIQNVANDFTNEDMEYLAGKIEGEIKESPAHQDPSWIVYRAIQERFCIQKGLKTVNVILTEYPDDECNTETVF